MVWFSWGVTCLDRWSSSSIEIIVVKLLGVIDS